jgi:23S rRNA-/tRNA-specific pseudouridylate synthase
MRRLPRKARSRMGKPDRVSVYEDRRWPRFSRELSVLYEDDAVVVLDKPAGLLAVPIKGSDTPSALSLLVAKLKLKRQRYPFGQPHSFTGAVMLLKCKA